MIRSPPKIFAGDWPLAWDHPRNGPDKHRLDQPGRQENARKSKVILFEYFPSVEDVACCEE
jgi:hypothetical protein